MKTGFSLYKNRKWYNYTIRLPKKKSLFISHKKMKSIFTKNWCESCFVLRKGDASK